MGINFISIGRLWLVGRSKNGRSHFKLILCCFLFIISPHTKFHPNRTKNTEVRNFHLWSILVGRAGRSKNGRRHFKLILCCFCPIISPHTKFHPNRTKNTEVRNFHFWSILVGWAGRSKNGRRYLKLILCCFCPIHGEQQGIKIRGLVSNRRFQFARISSLTISFFFFQALVNFFYSELDVCLLPADVLALVAEDDSDWTGNEARGH